MPFIAGLDLGQSGDYSALVVTDRTRVPDRAPMAAHTGKTANRFDVPHIHRWPLNTPYTAIIADLGDWYRTPTLRGSTLVVDGTGVGRAVVDMIRGAGLLATVVPVTITAGQKEGVGTVPKKDLVFAVVAALQTRRLRFGADLPLTPVLEKELETFRVKVTADRNETFAAWRESDKDDLCLALCLAVWYGEKTGGDGPWTTADAGPCDGLPPGTFGPVERPDTFYR